MAQQFRKYFPREINSESLAFYYDLVSSAQGYYYRLKPTATQTDLLPQSFWASELTGGVQQTSPVQQTTLVQQTAVIQQASLQQTSLVQQTSVVQQTFQLQQTTQAHSQADASSSESTVSNVRVVVHTRAISGQFSDNHWSIFLLTGGNSSVRVNMEANPGFITGQLFVKNYRYILSNTTLQYWDFAVKANITVRQLTGLITEKKRHLYNMSGGGSGCRYWIWVVLSDFANQNYLVDPLAGTTLWPKLLFRYSRTAQPVPLPMVEGEFVKDGEDNEGEEDEEDEEDE